MAAMEINVVKTTVAILRASRCSAWSSKRISDASMGYNNVFREFFSYGGNMRFERCRFRKQYFLAFSPNGLEKLRFRAYRSRFLHEHLQYFELFVEKRNGFAIFFNGSPVKIDKHVFSKLESVLCERRLRASHAGSQTNVQFLQFKWFRYVVIGSQIEKFQLVLEQMARRKYKDRCFPVQFPQFLYDRFSIQQWQSKIQYYCLELFFGE